MNLPPIQTCRPRSFRERGIAGSFTTPPLAGARLRLVPEAASYGSERAVSQIDGRPPASGSVDGPTLEVIVPNPSGGRGVYILPWSDIGALCRPTMHDVMVGRGLLALLEPKGTALTPALVRKAGWQAAAAGYAGRDAAEAAMRAMQRRQDGLVATRFTLLMEVTEQAERRDLAGGAAPVAFVQASAAEIEARGRRALIRLAQELGQAAPVMADLLDVLAEVHVDVGIGLGMAEAGYSRLVGALGRLQHDLAGLSQHDPQTGAVHDADVRDALGVAAAAQLASRMARALLDTARASVSDMAGMMALALEQPGSVGAACERVAWMLDGWEPVCRLWQGQPSVLPRHRALQEMAARIPVLPDEAEAWLGLPGGVAQQLFHRSSGIGDAASDEASGPERIVRHERLLALAG